MALANCPRCGALFNKLAVDCCKKCYDEEEALLRKTQDYLRQNRTAALFELLEEIDVEQWMVEKWVADKRIVINDPVALAAIPRCSSCGREIKPGQSMCKTCQFKKLSTKKSPAASSTEKREEDKKTARSGMHFKPR